MSNARPILGQTYADGRTKRLMSGAEWRRTQAAQRAELIERVATVFERAAHFHPDQWRGGPIWHGMIAAIDAITSLEEQP